MTIFLALLAVLAVLVFGLAVLNAVAGFRAVARHREAVTGPLAERRATLNG